MMGVIITPYSQPTSVVNYIIKTQPRQPQPEMHLKPHTPRHIKPKSYMLNPQSAASYRETKRDVHTCTSVE